MPQIIIDAKEHKATKTADKRRKLLNGVIGLVSLGCFIFAIIAQNPFDIFLYCFGAFGAIFTQLNK